MTQTDLLSLSLSLATLLTPLLVVWIAYRQFQLARDKVRLDLYQRRFAIYEKTVAFYQALIASAESQRTEEFSKLLREFITACRESQFLFEPSSGIFKLLEEFHAQAFKVIGFKEHGPEIMRADPAEFQKLHQMFQQALTYFENALTQLERAIAPYLNFRRVLA